MVASRNSYLDEPASAGSRSCRPAHDWPGLTSCGPMRSSGPARYRCRPRATRIGALPTFRRSPGCRFSPCTRSSASQAADVERFHLHEAAIGWCLSTAFMPHLSSRLEWTRTRRSGCLPISPRRWRRMRLQSSRISADMPSFENNLFAALNTAFLHDGALIIVPRNATIAEPVHRAVHRHASGDGKPSALPGDCRSRQRGDAGRGLCFAAGRGLFHQRGDRDCA